MGPSSTAAGSTEPTSFSSDRAAESLTAMGANFDRDEEGDAFAYWDENLFRFLTMGQSNEMFQVRGYWKATAPSDRLGEILTALNEWNVERIWPKAAARTGDGGIHVIGEVSIDYEHGATDPQLRQHIDCALSTTLSLFTWLEERYPEHTQWVEADES